MTIQCLNRYLTMKIKFEKDICLNKTLNTPDDSNIGYLIEFDLRYPDNIKEKITQNIFQFVQKL